jgi:uncharacterized 2Fe-2S/4Fe-4S cluster protein (DUF4445 family)
MPRLEIISGKLKTKVNFTGKVSISKILEKSELRVRKICAGNGACGMCLIKIISFTQNAINNPTPNEKLHLNLNQISLGERLACQTQISDDTKILILNPQKMKCIKNISFDIKNKILDETQLNKVSKFGKDTPTYGLAIDLGTTNIKMALFELTKGVLIASVSVINPQIQHGWDVLTRLNQANASKENALLLAESVIEEISSIISNITIQRGINSNNIIFINIVGNTAMLSLISGQKYSELLKPSNWGKSISTIPPEIKLWIEKWLVHPNCKIDLTQSLGGFVGSDLIAGLIAVNFLDSPETSLFLDIGTNSEIALFHNERLLVTSAAGGPAFEGSGLCCGMSASKGAIYKVIEKNNNNNNNNNKNTTEKNLFDVEIFGTDIPEGICATGLIDILALMLKNRIISPIGKFLDKNHSKGYPILPSFPKIFINHRDIDLFQQAKAAIQSAIIALCAVMKISVDKINHIYITGFLGTDLNIKNAQNIGLIPSNSLKSIEMKDNCALRGSCELLFSSKKQAIAKLIRDKAEIINLALWPHFDDIYMESLFLRPFN